MFSLGVVLYEMATGRRPFEARSAAELVSAILRDAPVPPTRLRPGLPGRVDRLIARCLEKEPRYRLQSAVDLGWELEQLKAEAGREGGQPRTIAVLPFVDQSREKDQDYLCDGLAEDILIALGKVKGLRVASRAASFRFRSPDADVKETGRRLGVEAIVHGSVRQGRRRACGSPSSSWTWPTASRSGPRSTSARSRTSSRSRARSRRRSRGP